MVLEWRFKNEQSAAPQPMRLKPLKSNNQSPAGICTVARSPNSTRYLSSASGKREQMVIRNRQNRVPILDFWFLFPPSFQCRHTLRLFLTHDPFIIFQIVLFIIEIRLFDERGIV